MHGVQELMIEVKENLVSLTWSKEIENFFIENNFFLGYPWRVKGIIKYGSDLKFNRMLRVEPFSCMAQGKLYSAGAFSYCRSKLIPPDFSIGRYCSIAPGVEVSDQEHPLDRVSTHSFTFKPHAKQLAKENNKDISIHRFNTLKNAPKIGHDVWIGKDALIKRGVRIGNGVVVAQRSIVTKDVPDYAIVAGSPARIIRYRFDENTINKLNESQWWNYSFFDFSDIDVTNIDSFIEKLNERIDKKSIAVLTGKLSLIEEMSKKFEVNYQ